MNLKGLGLKIAIAALAAGAAAGCAAGFSGLAFGGRGAEAMETLVEVGSDGKPVEGAEVRGALQTGDGLGDFASFCGLTDGAGLYTVKGRCTNRIVCGISKDGYYDSAFVIDGYGFSHKEKDGKWHPYGRKTKILLKKIVNPVVTGVRYVERDIPKFGEWLAFDLEKGDWAAPYGKGKAADAMIRFTAREKSAFDFGYAMELSFSHAPFAGAIRMKKDVGCGFTAAYAAETNAVYAERMKFEVDKTGAKRRIWDNLGKDEYLIFRVRTEVKADGTLASAHYGRIDGEWKFHERRTMRLGGIYFNEMRNDANLEDVHSLKDALKRQRMRE